MFVISNVVIGTDEHQRLRPWRLEDSSDHHRGGPATERGRKEAGLVRRDEFEPLSVAKPTAPIDSTRQGAPKLQTPLKP